MAPAPVACTLEASVALRRSIGRERLTQSQAAHPIRLAAHPNHHVHSDHPSLSLSLSHPVLLSLLCDHLISTTSCLNARVVNCGVVIDVDVGGSKIETEDKRGKWQIADSEGAGGGRRANHIALLDRSFLIEQPLIRSTPTLLHAKSNFDFQLNRLEA